MEIHNSISMDESNKSAMAEAVHGGLFARSIEHTKAFTGCKQNLAKGTYS